MARRTEHQRRIAAQKAASRRFRRKEICKNCQEPRAHHTKVKGTSKLKCLFAPDHFVGSGEFLVADKIRGAATPSMMYKVMPGPLPWVNPVPPRPPPYPVKKERPR